MGGGGAGEKERVMLAECFFMVGAILLADGAAETRRVGAAHHSLAPFALVEWWWAVPTLQSLMVVDGDVEAGEATPIASLNFDWKKAYEMPVSRRYSVARKDKEGRSSEIEGFLISSTKIDADAVVLLDEMIDKTDAGERKFREIREKCAMDSLLTPTSIEMTAIPTEGPPRVGSTSIASGKVTAALPDGEKKEYELRPGSITRSALLRILGQLPREPGRKYLFLNLFESDVHGYSDGPFIIECMGPEAIDRGGQQIDCVKFTLRDDRGVIEDAFWVDNEDVLQRIVSSGTDVFDLVGNEPADP